MVTPPPKGWDDIHQFLEQGGYKDILQTRNLRSWLPKATAIMLSKKDHVNWLNRWVRVTFDENNWQGCHIPKSEIIRVFFETAMFVNCGKYSEALQIVNKFRKTYNFTSFSEFPPRNVSGNRSRSLPNGINTNQSAGRTDTFDETDSTTVNGMDFVIPSGLHIPGYARSDSPLSSLPDEADDVMLESLDTSPSFHPDPHLSTSQCSRLPEHSRKKLPQIIIESGGKIVHHLGKSVGLSEKKSFSTQTNSTFDMSSSNGDILPSCSGVPPVSNRALRHQRREATSKLAWKMGSKKEKRMVSSSGGVSPQSSSSPLATSGGKGMRHQSRNKQKWKTLKTGKTGWNGTGWNGLGPSRREKHVLLRSQESESGMTLRCPTKLQHIEKDIEASLRKRTGGDPSPDCPGEQPPSKRSRTCPLPTMLTAPRMQLHSESEFRETVGLSDIMDPPTVTAMGDTLNFASVPLTVAPENAPSSISESLNTSELTDCDATLIAPLPTHTQAGLSHRADLIAHGSALENSEQTLVFDQAVPSDTTSLGGVCTPGVLPPASKHPSLTAEFHLNLTRSWSLGNTEPPWRESFDPPCPPSNARPPAVGDTHFWSLPPSTPGEQEPVHLSLLDFPPKPSQLPVSFNRVYKPCLPVGPPVWAQSRQELCESLHYFRSYQGGVYTQKKRARGYLLDGHPAVQDLWTANGRCIISHAGGNSAFNKETGQTVLVDDQTIHSTSCNALLNSWKFGQPIVLIAGNGYNLFPYDLGHRRYVVLGYYLITHAWAEPEHSLASPRGYFVRWKFMFQWIQAQGKPWWIQSDSEPDDLPVSEPSNLPSRVCETCLHPSPIIYNYGWVCTQPDCSIFFRRIDSLAMSPDSSGYYPDFLTLRKDPPEFQGLNFQISPKLPVERKELGGREHRQAATSRHFWKGWWCKNCGRLSCREDWTHWECHTCRTIFKIKAKIQRPPHFVGKILIQTSKTAGISVETRRLQLGFGSARCQSFRLPLNRGIVHLVQADDRAKSDADGIWRQYQVDAQEPGFFRRYSMKTHKLKGRMLSHYFSQNSGEPYEVWRVFPLWSSLDTIESPFLQYVGGTDNTVPLNRYTSVSQALALIRSQVSHALGQKPLFNEILSAAYMAEQKMEFHSDGEKDLGPVIASLSLGSPATMRFRPVPRKWDAEEFPDRKSPPIDLILTLRHGDVLIMEGAEIQEYYQHAVHPWGFRIAATARYIRTAAQCNELIASRDEIRVV